MSEAQERPVLAERVAAHVMLVTLNRPQAMNAVNPELAQALGAIVAESEADGDVRAVVLTGAGGRAFCAGADLKAIAAGRSEALWTAAGGFAGFVQVARRKPWIAAVDGAALAGGSEIALACDMIVAGEGARFGLPEVTRGLVAGAGGLLRLPRAVPRGVALEMIATGAPIDAVRAAALGLVCRLVPAGQAVAAAVALAEVIAGNAPLAVQESLVLARMALDQTEAEAREATQAARRRIQATEDYKEGPRAFIEKRAPVWKGR